MMKIEKYFPVLRKEFYSLMEQMVKENTAIVNEQRNTVQSIDDLLKVQNQIITLQIAQGEMLHRIQTDIQEKMGGLQSQNGVLEQSIQGLQSKNQVLQRKHEDLQQIANMVSNQIAKVAPKRVIQHMDFHLAEHCNLNCKGCSTFSPIAEKKFANPELFEKDLKRLYELVGNKIIRIHLLGGEPLLHPDIEKFATICRGVFTEARIDFTTNGLLIYEMPESFWQVLRDCNIAIKYTHYPVKFDYQNMVEYIKERGVEVFSAGGEIKYFRKIPMDTAGTNNINLSYSKCPYSDCAQLRNGKLFLCPAAAFSDVLNKHMEKSGKNEKFALTSNDYVDLYRAEDDNEIFDFLSGPAEFCQYCNMNQMDALVPWQTSGKDISEWVNIKD